MEERKLDSNEEIYISWYFDELIKIGVAISAEYQPVSFVLSEAVSSTHIKPMKRVEDKVVSETILNGHLYTADVLVYWDKKYKGVIFDTIEGESKFRENSSMSKFVAQKDNKGEYFSVIEVKPSFDQNNMTRLAIINQKWVWEKHKVFVNIIIPDKIFKQTFAPVKYILEMVYKKAYKKKVKKPKKGEPKFIFKKAGESKLKYKPRVVKEYFKEKGKQHSLF